MTEFTPIAAGTLKILVIEDDTLTRMTLCRILEKLNYTTFGACNGLEGIRLYRQIKPDLVLTDLIMPDKEGLSTISEILGINPRALIIAMSGGGGNKDMNFLKLATTIGANRTITKPFTPRQILEMMRDMNVGG